MITLVFSVNETIAIHLSCVLMILVSIYAGYMKFAITSNHFKYCILGYRYLISYKYFWISIVGKQG
jgi:hypothetical protein